MAKLACPQGCRKGFLGAAQSVEGGRSVQRATCAGCGTQVVSQGGVVMGRVQSMTQTRSK